MNILVLGAGAIGGYYGARLSAAGASVSFLVRPTRAGVLQQHGLRIASPLGSIEQQVRTVLAPDLKPEYDLVLLACKTYDLDPAMDAVAGALRDDTVILPFLNGLLSYDKLDARFGRDRVAGGIAYIATMLAPSGAIRHLSPGDSVIVGARAQRQEPVVRELHRLLALTPGERRYAGDIDQQLWNKWIMIASGAMMTSLMRASVGAIVSTMDGAALMRQAMTECRAVAAHAGHDMPQAAVDNMQGLLLDPASSWVASMMRDIAQGAARLEADDIVGDLIARAETFNLDVPLVRVAYAHLQSYAAERRRQPSA